MLPLLSGQGSSTNRAALWRAKVHALAADLAPMQVALLADQERLIRLERDELLLEETVAFAKHDERLIVPSEDGCAAWVNKEDTVRLSTANTKLTELENKTATTITQSDSPPLASSPVLLPSEPSVPDKHPSLLSEALEIALQEKTAAVTELQRTLVAADTLCAQLANLVRALGDFDLHKLDKILSCHDVLEDAKIRKKTDMEVRMLLGISKILDRIKAHDGFNKITSSDLAKQSSSKSQPVAVAGLSNLPSDDLFPAPTKPMTTVQLQPVDLNYVIGANSAGSQATSAAPAQETCSSFCFTPEEAVALKEYIHDKTGPNYGKPVVKELRPGIIVKAGFRTRSYEARAMEFIARYTNVPVPRVLASFDFEGYPCIVMTKIQGTTLEHALQFQNPWLNLSLVCEQLRDVVRQLRSMPLDTVLGPGASDRIAPACDAWDSKHGMLIGGPWMDFPVSDVQAYQTLVDTRLSHRPAKRRLLSHVNPQVKTVLCHGDLVACNIMVAEHGLTGVIDWESLGTYPPEWEIESALGSCGGQRDMAALVYSYIPPHSPCSQAAKARRAHPRRYSCPSADCVKHVPRFDSTCLNQTG